MVAEMYSPLSLEVASLVPKGNFRCVKSFRYENVGGANILIKIPKQITITPVKANRSFFRISLFSIKLC